MRSQKETHLPLGQVSSLGLRRKDAEIDCDEHEETNKLLVLEGEGMMYSGVKCLIHDCNREAKGLGLCPKHYTAYRYGAFSKYKFLDDELEKILSIEFRAKRYKYSQTESKEGFRELVFKNWKWHRDKHKERRKNIPSYNKENKRIYIKALIIRRNFGLSLEEYNDKIKDGCMICGFREVTDLHHKNGKEDNSELVCLCPNHHQLLHRKHLTFEELVDKYAK